MFLTGAEADIRSAVREAFQSGPPKRLGVAVSGGGDSVALLHILLHCFEDTPVELHAATVDHGLRPEARHEAVWVADLCERYGVAHSTLRWRGWDGSGNLQDKARQARYDLLTDWAQSFGIADIAIGHTADDQAETLLMRLARSSGVNGLSAMSRRRTVNGVNLIRPMLGLGREQLRSYLKVEGLGWIDDPGNDNAAFDRIKARQALAALEPLGVSVRALTDVARNMEQAREALDWYSFLAARDFVDIDGGDVLIEHRRLRTLPEEIVRRLVVRAIGWISGGGYAPRSASVSHFVAAARDRQSATLSGCQMLHQGPHVWICREYQAVRTALSAPAKTWDNRWVLTGPDMAGCKVKPLGRKGVLLCGDWRGTGRPYATLLASPSVWRNGELVAAPLAGVSQGWKAELVGGSEEFYAGLLSH